MYARDVDGRTLTLAVSGMLWERSLVMIDSETETLWSQLLGEAMQGPLQGEHLEPLPAFMTDWQTWKTRYPATTAVILSRTAERFRRELYRDLDRYVIGLTIGKEARAWRFDSLAADSVVNDRLGKRPVLVVFDPATVTAAVFDRTIAGRRLTFTNRDGKLIDRETGSTWDRITGRRLNGIANLNGETKPDRADRLTRLPASVSFVHSWRRFHPETTFWQ